MIGIFILFFAIQLLIFNKQRKWAMILSIVNLLYIAIMFAYHATSTIGIHL